jgi:hypothetical protein
MFLMTFIAAQISNEIAILVHVFQYLRLMSSTFFEMRQEAHHNIIMWCHLAHYLRSSSFVVILLKKHDTIAVSRLTTMGRGSVGNAAVGISQTI